LIYFFFLIRLSLLRALNIIIYLSYKYKYIYIHMFRKDRYNILLYIYVHIRVFKYSLCLSFGSLNRMFDCCCFFIIVFNTECNWYGYKHESYPSACDRNAARTRIAWARFGFRRHSRTDVQRVFKRVRHSKWNRKTLSYNSYTTNRWYW